VSAIRDTWFGIGRTVPATQDTRVSLVVLVYCQARATPNDQLRPNAATTVDYRVDLYEWASHQLTLRVGYKTAIFSETDDNLFADFKTIVDELCPEGDGVNENYPDTGKHFFFKNEMHDVLHFYGGKTVK
jgi:hypothetical protein